MTFVCRGSHLEPTLCKAETTQTPPSCPALATSSVVTLPLPAVPPLLVKVPEVELTWSQAVLGAHLTAKSFHVPAAFLTGKLPVLPNLGSDFDSKIKNTNSKMRISNFQSRSFFNLLPKSRAVSKSFSKEHQHGNTIGEPIHGNPYLGLKTRRGSLMCCHHALDTERFLVHRCARNLSNSSRAAIQGKVVVRQLAAWTAGRECL